MTKCSIPGIRRTLTENFLESDFIPGRQHFFSDEPLSKTANGFFDLQIHFQTAEKLLRQKLSPTMTLQDFKTVAEEILLTLLSRPLQKLPVQSHLIIDSIVQMIRTRGRQNLSALLKDIHASERQLERLFADAFSLSPKKVSWNEFTRSKRTCLSLSDFYNTRFTICFMIFKNHNFRRHEL